MNSKEVANARYRRMYKTNAVFREKHNAYSRAYYQKHKARIRLRDRKNFAKRKQAIYAARKIRYFMNPDVRAKRIKNGKDYYQKNKARLDKINMANQRRYYRVNPMYRLRSVCISRIRLALKAQHAERLYSYGDLIGCSWKELQLYLESKFQPGMKWAHHRRRSTRTYKAFHLDHIQPVNSFDLHYGSNQLKAFNYKNLQPLYISDHITKSDKYLNSLERKYRLCKQRARQYRRALKKYINEPKGL